MLKALKVKNINRVYSLTLICWLGHRVKSVTSEFDSTHALTQNEKKYFFQFDLKVLFVLKNEGRLFASYLNKIKNSSTVINAILMLINFKNEKKTSSVNHHFQYPAAASKHC